MTDLERFLAVCRGQKPDYVPIFGFSGAPGVAGGCMKTTHDHLVEQGMPDWVDGCRSLAEWGRATIETWHRYWGTTGPLYCGFSAHEPALGFREEKRIEGEWEIIEAETGALTRQVLDNDITYSMPHYIRYHVRDRKSWEFYRDRVTPGARWSDEQINEAAKQLDNRDNVLAVGAGGSWGSLRGLVGPEHACTILHDDPMLAHEILDWFSWIRRTYVFPVIERLRPEIIQCGEDMCYNHGMFISPAHFREFCAPAYTEIGEIARDCGVAMVAIDTDGNYMHLVPLVAECGVNCIYPSEVKAGNDLFAIREHHPNFILMGWLEKESVNEGMERLIEQEVMTKVPPLLTKGRYFPNLDHGIQPLVSFESLCKLMALLHEVTGNPEGEFPRIRP